MGKNDEKPVKVGEEGFKPKKHEGESSEDEGDEIDPEIKLKRRQIDEILTLPAADHPGMALVTAPLTGSNFLNWSRSIRRGLAARSKLELLDGTFMEPDEDSKYYKRWVKVDYMVCNWINNSISKELVNSFNHIESSYKLWAALKQRFGGSNGPKILKLQREIFHFTQGSLNVMMYFNQLNALWDEMDMLHTPLNCTCSAKALMDKRQDEQRLLTFLIGLNDSYDATRTQIMLLKPLPTLDDAYSMIVQVEDQRKLSDGTQDNRNMMAMNIGKQPTYGAAAAPQQHFYDGGKQPFQKQGQPNAGGAYKKRISKEEKRKMKCTHCQGMGHGIEECFKLHGVPDWFIKLKEGKGPQPRANFTETNVSTESYTNPHADQRDQS